MHRSLLGQLTKARAVRDLYVGGAVVSGAAGISFIILGFLKTVSIGLALTGALSSIAVTSALATIAKSRHDGIKSRPDYRMSLKPPFTAVFDFSTSTSQAMVANTKVERTTIRDEKI